MADIPESQQQYGSILTIAGENAEQNGKLLKKPIEFTHIAIGDANDTYVQPDRTQSALVHEIARLPVNVVDVVEGTQNTVPTLVVEALLPDTLVNVVIREFAVVAKFNGNTYLHAVGNCARVYVPAPQNNGGETNEVAVQMTFTVTSVDPIVMINPNVVTASREYVNKQMAAHLAAVDPHPQYVNDAEMSSAIEKRYSVFDRTFTTVGTQAEGYPQLFWAIATKSAATHQASVTYEICTDGDTNYTQRYGSIFINLSSYKNDNSWNVMVSHGSGNSEVIEVYIEPLQGGGITVWVAGKLWAECRVRKVNFIRAELEPGAEYPLTRSTEMPLNAIRIRPCQFWDDDARQVKHFGVYDADKKVFSPYNLPDISQVTGAQFAPYDPQRTYLQNDICSVIDAATGERRFYLSYAPFSNQGHDPNDPLNRHEQWPNHPTPCWWIEYHGTVPGTPVYWPSDDIPENALQVIDMEIDAGFYHRIAARWPSLVANGKINLVDLLGRYLRIADGNQYLIGTTHEDAIRNISGSIGNMAYQSDTDPSAGGVFYLNSFAGNAQKNGTPASAAHNDGYGFDASRVVPVADENQPRSAMMNFIVFM